MTHPDRRTLGRRLKAARILAELKTSEVADQLGIAGFKVSQSTIFAWERGESGPPAHVLPLLVQILEPPGGLDFLLANERAAS
jgi:transcriptional regulator with XRE-family HTH domain